jgi:hypothetical protein
LKYGITAAPPANLAANILTTLYQAASLVNRLIRLPLVNLDRLRIRFNRRVQANILIKVCHLAVA